MTERPGGMLGAMASTGLLLFETALGFCGLVFSSEGICGVALPETGPDRVLASLRKRFPTAGRLAPTDAARQAKAGILALLRGRASELSAVPLDLAGVPPFSREIYGVVRRIPPGSTMTYGEVAAAVGRPRAARAVGQAMRKNPVPLLVPCHRVLGKDGALVGFSAPGGTRTKGRLLRLEGALQATSSSRRIG